MLNLSARWELMLDLFHFHEAFVILKDIEDVEDIEDVGENGDVRDISDIEGIKNFPSSIILFLILTIRDLTFCITSSRANHDLQKTLFSPTRDLISRRMGSWVTRKVHYGTRKGRNKPRIQRGCTDN